MISTPGADKMFLGIEGGGTRTVALLANAQGAMMRRIETGPANLRLLSDAQLAALLRSIAVRLPRPDAVAIGLAGAWVPADNARIQAAAGKAWPGVPCKATNDLETSFAAASEGASSKDRPVVLIVSGTGSCCYTRKGNVGIKVGGWGHILGDKGSGYGIGLRGLKAAVLYYDQDGIWPELGARLLRRAQLNNPNDLMDWAQRATKSEIAHLALEVLISWERRDKVAAQIIAAAADALARDGVACARRTGIDTPHFVLAGSLLIKSARFARAVSRRLRMLLPRASVETLGREGAWGAVTLACRLADANDHGTQTRPRGKRLKGPTRASADAPVRSRKSSPTEGRHPRSMRLDRMGIGKAIQLMLSEDATIPRKLLRHRTQIARAVRVIVNAFRRGGRLIYVGAGTSGRMGVLDASECPPTFRTPAEQVQGIIAGGQAALWESIEGAEDDQLGGTSAIEFRRVGRRDVVVGLAASGTTPFVWGALNEARRRAATTILVCFNPWLEIPRASRPDIVIAPNLGAELLTGSTRLKAGTATKLILNIFTTLAMVQLGKVLSNLMVDLLPSNTKLRDRAVRIVQELTGADYEQAGRALERNGWMIKKAVVSRGRKRGRAI
jgi:N-acetylmuramic acid 6-phosphate etherase